MKKAKKTLKTKAEGITLIALVVTIIVLLILAGISIAMLTGENGILNRAKEANEKTEIATEDEQRKMATYEAAMNTKLTYFQGVPIPAGFAPTKMPGESNVDEGLVITDSQGNEFVWIPVKSKEEYQKKIGICNYIDGKPSEITDINEIQQGDDLGVTNILGREIESGKQDRPEIDIVVDAGGFYVGRYEAGVEVNEKIDWESNPKIVVKKNVQPARGLGYRDVIVLANEWKNESNVQSGLITGTQWDVMCNFIGWNIANEDCGTWGNYLSTESYKYSGYCSETNTLNWVEKSNMIKLGKVDDVKKSCAVFPTGVFLTKYGSDTAQKNIYDIAGNVFEFTTEILNDNQIDRSRRGGDAGTGTYRYATMRANGQAFDWATSGWADGFRLVLYVKG